MTEIVKAFRERVPAARLIGKRYSMAEEGAASHWGEWFENGWFLPLEMLGALKESEGAFYGFMVARGEEDREYWIACSSRRERRRRKAMKAWTCRRGKRAFAICGHTNRIPRSIPCTRRACARAPGGHGRRLKAPGRRSSQFCALNAITAPALPRPTAKAASFWIMACIFAQRKNGREPRKAYGCAMATGRCTSKPMRPWWNI